MRLSAEIGEGEFGGGAGFEESGDSFRDGGALFVLGFVQPASGGALLRYRTV